MPKPKVLTDKDLAAIVTSATIDPLLIDDAETYANYVKDLAQLVTSYFGGIVGNATHCPTRKEWVAEIIHDENVPEEGCVYAPFDTATVWP